MVPTTLPSQIQHFQSTQYEEIQIYNRQREKSLKKWLDLKLDRNWFDQDPKIAEFLIDSKLIFSIIGFANSSQDDYYKRGILYDRKDGLKILKKGEYVSARNLLKNFEYSRGYSFVFGNMNDDSQRKWTYLGGIGLCSINVWKYDKLPPLTRLSSCEYTKLLQHSLSNRNNRGNSKCILQLVTYPRGIISASSLWKKYAISKPVHASIRIIDKERYVYSVSVCFNEKSRKLIKESRNNFAAINIIPPAIDVESFRQHEGRIITNFPIPQDACSKVLAKVARLNKQQIRFHMLEQNCSSFAVNMLAEAGVRVHDLTLRVRQINALKNTLPYRLNRIPIPSYFKYLTSTCLNIFLMCKGNGKSLEKLTHTKIEENFKNFTAPKTPLFGFAEFDHSLELIKWQLKKESTYVYPSREPSLTILPPTKEDRMAVNLKIILKEAYGL